MTISSIAVASGKGGVGKTLLACALAQVSGWPLLDTDPQCSASNWADDREDEPPVITTQLARVEAELHRRPQAVIDTPGALVGNLTQALAAVDLVLLPTSDNRLELDALPASLTLAQQSGRPAVVLLNRINPRSEVGDLITLLAEELGATVCPVVIRERASHKRAMNAGRTALELEPDSAAAQEITALWSWLQEWR